jgi:PTH1 family peptidyl-tRNA hydrolase
MATPIRLVAGLGNPGRGYARTRHNVGFWFADALAQSLGATFDSESKFAGDVARRGDLRIVKPTTFMNESGRSVGTIARFFGIEPAEILVVHDELDLPAGDVKLKQGGGHAGHNGLRDIHAALGSADFWRLRFGIGHPRDSLLPQQDVVDYVLQPPGTDDVSAIEKAIERGLDAWPAIAAGDMERAMLALHTRPKRPPAAAPAAPAKDDDRAP